MNDASERLRTLLQNCFDASSQGQSALAKFLGLSPSAISRMLNGERQISAVELIGIREFFDISFSDIEKALDLQIRDEVDLLVIAHDRISQKEYISNFHVASYEEDKSGISLPDFIFSSIKLNRTDYLRWVRVYDDAMAPSINRGDIVIIDNSNLGGIGLFLIEVAPDQLSARRLDGRWEDGELMVHVTPENPKFRSYEAPVTSLKIVGQIIAKLTTNV